jgi:hypothetical protein
LASFKRHHAYQRTSTQIEVHIFEFVNYSTKSTLVRKISWDPSLEESSFVASQTLDIWQMAPFVHNATNLDND